MACIRYFIINTYTLELKFLKCFSIFMRKNNEKDINEKTRS